MTLACMLECSSRIQMDRVIKMCLLACLFNVQCSIYHVQWQRSVLMTCNFQQNKKITVKKCGCRRSSNTKINIEPNKCLRTDFILNTKRKKREFLCTASTVTAMTAVEREKKIAVSSAKHFKTNIYLYKKSNKWQNRSALFSILIPTRKFPYCVRRATSQRECECILCVLYTPRTRTSTPSRVVRVVHAYVHHCECRSVLLALRNQECTNETKLNGLETKYTKTPQKMNTK